MSSLWNTLTNLLQGSNKRAEDSACIVENVEALFMDSCDYSRRELASPAHGRQATLIYLSSIVDQARLSYEVIEPLLSAKGDAAATRSARVGPVTSTEHAARCLLEGNALIDVKDESTLFYAELAEAQGRAVEKPTTESTIAGPQDSFVEHIRTNLALVRQKLRTPALHCVEYTVGEKTNTTLYLLYVDGVAPRYMVDGIKERVSNLHIGEMLDISYIESLIGISPISPFPQAFYTQRPDKVAGNLLEGRLALLANGSPSALVFPAAFIDLFQSPADYYSRATTTVMVRLLRILGFFLATTLPALYISVVSFDFEMIPPTLAIPIANFRAGIPFSPAVEVFLMVLIVDTLQEGATRLPAKIAQTVGVVGGFVLGQAVIQAKLVSPLAVIVVAASVIGAFTLPNYELNGLVRFIRYLLLLAAGALTGVGVTIVWCAIAIHMCSMEILGVPYLRPVAPMRLGDHSDFLFRGPYRQREPYKDKREEGRRL